MVPQRAMKLLILSDIHGNWPALEAVLAAEPECDTVVFCGDAVDYGPQPVECLRWLMGNTDHIVRGNHDNALGFDVDCRCMGSFREYSVATRSWHRTLLSQADHGFLRQMPTLDWFEWEGKHFRMTHATPQGDLFEYLNMEQWGERVSGLESDFVLLGHTHVQGMRTFGKVSVVNPGSVGLRVTIVAKPATPFMKTGPCNSNGAPTTSNARQPPFEPRRCRSRSLRDWPVFLAPKSEGVKIHRTRSSSAAPGSESTIAISVTLKRRGSADTWFCG